MRNFGPLMTAAILITPFAATSAAAEPAAQRLTMRSKPLKSALLEVARRYKVEILFSNDTVRSFRAPAISGMFTAQEALSALLVGSGLAVRGSRESGFMIVRAPQSDIPPAAGMPDILVVGHKTQNADIRRRSNDVQPYQVLARRDIRMAQAGTVDELLGKRVSQNTAGLSSAQKPQGSQGSVRSNFNLRGLGMDETLVLIDGRPMPRVPGMKFALAQADVNALSTGALERAEVLTSTAGGIYGPGAMGGVINLVLRRDYRGAEVTATSGLTSRGDGAYRRWDARAGFTPDGGATDVMIAYSRIMSDGLSNGERDYADRTRARKYAGGLPSLYVELPLSSSVNIASIGGTPLTLRAAYGGQALGSSITYLAPQDGRSPGDLGTALSSRAGGLDTGLPSGEGGTGSTLVAAQRSSMLLANLRHRFGSRLEAYLDLIRLSDKGIINYSRSSLTGTLSADDPRNPFEQDIGFVMPAPGLGTKGGTETRTTRVNAGLIVSLADEWKANLDVSLGRVRQLYAMAGRTYGLDALYALYGVPLAGRPALDPFSSAADFNAALADYQVQSSFRFAQVNRMSDGALRIAGPLARLGGGPVTATFLLEQRLEKVRPSRYDALSEPFGMPYGSAVPGFSERIRSAYAELHAPLIDRSSAIVPFRGLELQLAARRDATRARLQSGYLRDVIGAPDGFDSAGRAAITYTVGAKALPVPWLLVRASVATGEQTPPLSELGQTGVLISPIFDPRRGNKVTTTPVDLSVYGKGKITPERAKSFSAGLVLTPLGADGAVFSLDYTHIHRTREVDGRVIGDANYFVYNEAAFPGRVTRLPLSVEDAALGYTGGVITQIDTSYLSTGWTKVDAVDAHLSFPIGTATFGDFVVRGSLTWQPRYTRYIGLDAPAASYVDHSDGVLKWRGNGGIDWVSGPASISLSGQYYGPYRVTSATGSPSYAESVLAQQGRVWVSSQLTFDLAAAYRWELQRSGGLRPRSMDLRFGISDIFDHRPAIDVVGEPGYSIYANPYRRRFELALTLGV